MPAKSKAQLGLLFAKEERGELPKGTARRWARHTPDIKSLPQHVGDESDSTLGTKAALLAGTGSIGNTTSLLNPVPPIPTPAASPMQQGIRQTAMGYAKPNASPQTPQSQASGPGQWAPGVQGSPVYPPGQGPVSGQVPKTASIGTKAAIAITHQQKGIERLIKQK